MKLSEDKVNDLIHIFVAMGEEKKPKCCSAKTALIMLSIVLMSFDSAQLILEKVSNIRVCYSILVLIDIFLIISLLKDALTPLKCLKRIFIFNFAILLVTLLTGPILLTAMISSGVEAPHSWLVDKTFGRVLAQKNRRKRFLLGLVYGYSFEFLVGFSMIICALKILLLHRQIGILERKLKVEEKYAFT